MDDTVDIKEEPVWCGVYEEAPVTFLSSNTTEVCITREHDELGGIDEIGRSSSAASINLSHKPMHIKSEQDIKQEPNFAFVEMDVLAAPPTDSCDPLGADPLQCSSQPLANQEVSGPKQEVMFVEVKQEPIEEEDSSLVVSPLQSNQELLLMQVPPAKKARLEVLKKKSALQLKAAPLRYILPAVTDQANGSSRFILPAVPGQANRSSKSGTDQPAPVSIIPQYANLLPPSGFILHTRPTKNMYCDNEANEETTSQDNIEKHECGLCKIKFTDQHNLASHECNNKNNCSPNLKRFSCDICKATFTRSSGLTRHKIIHSGEKPYSCDICTASFTQSSHLINHKRTHSGEKPYSCDICEARFTNRTTVSCHKRTHSGEKPYSCDICKASFSQSSHLTDHKRTHTGEKPFSCDICTASFSQSNHLINHKRTHSGEKPYSCDLCKGRFTKNSDLTRHKRTHSGTQVLNQNVNNF